MSKERVCGPVPDFVGVAIGGPYDGEIFRSTWPKLYVHARTTTASIVISPNVPSTSPRRRGVYLFDEIVRCFWWSGIEVG